MCGAEPVPRDDRGRPLPPTNRQDLVHALRSSLALRSTLATQIYSLFIIVMGFGGFAFMMAPTLSVRVAASLVFLVIVAAVAIHSRLGRGRAQQDRLLVSSVARAGRCPICGYAIRDLGHAESGCVSCPECGSAWHSDRWAHAPRNALELALVTVHHAVKPGTIRFHMDDRAGYTPTTMHWSAPWYESLLARRRTGQRLDPRLTSFIRDTWKDKEQVLRRLLLERVGCAVLVALIVFFAAEESIGRGLGIVIAVLGVPGMFVVTAIDAGNHVHLRDAAVRHGVCASCGELLDLNQPRQFDGCIQCAKCAAAWKVDATPSAPASSPNAAALGQPHEGPTSA
jgi:hypothetical protein